MINEKEMHGENIIRIDINKLTVEQLKELAEMLYYTCKDMKATKKCNDRRVWLEYA